MPRRSALPGIINFAVFILLEIASLYLLSHSSDLQKTWIANAGNAFKGAIWGSSEKVRNFFSLRGTNEKLAQDNFILQKELISLREQLRLAGADTVKIGELPGYTTLPAEVVKMSHAKQHNYIIVNKGYEDGVQEKSGIVTREGVVGIIDAVSAHFSYALSFQNADISISARLGSEGGSGLLVWDGKSSDGAILKEIPLQYKYSPGDTIYTSGHSLVFPPDIPLGTAGKAKVVNGSTNEIQVTLFQEFKAIRYVTIVHNNSFDEVEEFLR